MKKIILILVLVLGSVSTFAQTLSDSIHWDTPYYTIDYSEKLEQPKHIWYAVVCPHGTASRAGMDFYG
jgi:hypothetical protein